MFFNGKKCSVQFVFTESTETQQQLQLTILKHSHAFTHVEGNHNNQIHILLGWDFSTERAGLCRQCDLQFKHSHFPFKLKNLTLIVIVCARHVLLRAKKLCFQHPILVLLLFSLEMPLNPARAENNAFSNSWDV